MHLRYAISWRNRWMVQRSDFAVCYVRHTWGGAHRYMEYACQQGKTVINLGETE